ncbi:spore coat protein [Clostridium beijerinckii]|uniref:spore coat protein n=1 Tax=Clostridium beijerinckii TaxID=1520 RepID=UPI00080A2A72|nr:spore coat protein [Clostridium beijerinckii]OCA98881.1 coat protein F [Clostridium beijerinckii]
MQLNLTQKEKMLLEDQKSHEEICIQKYSNYANQVQDPQLKQICKNNEQIERSHLNTINQLLSGNVPQMNQQQGGQKNQGVDQNVNKSQSTTSNLSDKEICSDLLMTEKYVSGAYDTAIFEFKDTEVRDVLNHIQKEEQKHGESIFKYMESKGMYNVQ